jgi:hypothetical protein
VAVLALSTALAGCATGEGTGVGAAEPDASPAAAQTVAGSRWRPAVGTTWQWQLTGTIDQSVAATVYGVDGFDTPVSTVAALHAKGRKVICYINAGAWEDWRPDASAFPASVLGTSNGWDGERWLDIRRADVLGPIMAKRFDMCRRNGYDAVEPDNLDGYANASGFPLTADQQLAYNRLMADLAHARGMSIGLKNDLDQLRELEPAFDFAVNEECYAYDECDLLKPFIAADKAVLHVEYSGSTGTFCPATTSLRFSSMLKDLDLTAWRDPC